MTTRSQQDGDRSESRLRLILAAERLIATRGFHVTNREILLAAGHRNNSAIQYHFGSRIKLIEAIWYLHSAPVNLHRADMITKLPPPEERTTRQLVDAHIQPFIAELLNYTPSYWARFNERQMLRMPLQFTRQLGTDLDQRDDGPPLRVLSNLFEMIEQHPTHPHIATRRADRVALTFRFVISSFASWERDTEQHINLRPLPEFADHITDLAVTMLDLNPAPDRQATADKISTR